VHVRDFTLGQNLLAHGAARFMDAYLPRIALTLIGC
jgi:hypothetical protein